MVFNVVAFAGVAAAAAIVAAPAPYPTEVTTSCTGKETRTIDTLLPVPTTYKKIPSYTTTYIATDKFTTFCPEPTTLTYDTKTYVVTSATTLTITDCKYGCTVTKPYAPTSSPIIVEDTISPPKPTSSPIIVEDTISPPKPTSSPIIVEDTISPPKPTSSPIIVVDTISPPKATSSPIIVVDTISPPKPTSSPIIVEDTISPPKPTSSPIIVVDTISPPKPTAPYPTGGPSQPAVHKPTGTGVYHPTGTKPVIYTGGASAANAVGFVAGVGAIGALFL